MISIIKNDIILNNKHNSIFLRLRKKNFMNTKKLAILVGVLVVVLGVVLVAVLTQKPASKTNTPVTTQTLPTINTPEEKEGVVDPITHTTPTTPTTKETPPPVAVSPLAVMPGSPEAPKQEVVAVNEIPAAAIKLSISDKGFSPKEFTVSAGQSVQLAITAVGENTHVFIFPNASLMALTSMVSNSETKVMTFKAPAAGSYPFRDDIPDFRNNTGTMIVK